jgi:catechol 2,3-dioxygenase-like lactoylglutathione lyase family enzyme
MSDLKFTSTCIFVKDIQISKDFYTKFFGQEVQYDFGKNVSFKSGITIWEVREGHEIQKQLLENSGKQNGRFELYFETEDLDSIVEMITKNQIKKLHELKEEPWGQRTIRIYDPDGHLIEIGETLKSFVTRLQNVMSEEEVSRKTGIPVEELKGLILNE